MTSMATTHSLEYVTPSVIKLPEMNDDVKKYLTYKDKTVQYQISRLKRNFYVNKDWKEATLIKMNGELFKTAYWEYEGNFYTYGGLAQNLSQSFGWPVVKPKYTEPKRSAMPWAKPPGFAMWRHQEDAVAKLLEQDHAAISCPTGSGKSRILLELVKTIGLPTIIITPSKSISYQIYNEFVERFGANKVGFFGDGKKDIKKFITVSISASLANIKPGSKEWDFMKTKQLMLADESHTVPRDTLEPVCMNLLGHCLKRYFVSATQMRNDGKDLLLEGIIGPIVYEKPFKELVEEKILAEPVWRFFNVPMSPAHGYSLDAMKETRNHLYRNENVNILAAEMANKAVQDAGRPTVILIDEFWQFVHLMDKIKVPFVFAHGGATSSKEGDEESALQQIPEKYLKMEASDAISDFNSGKVKLLIGTSAVSTGVDLKPTQCLIYMQGGISEIKVKQGVGRGTRMGPPGKTDCWVIDFIVNGSKTLERHANARKEIYESMYGSAVII